MNMFAEPMIPIAARRFGSWRISIDRQAFACDELAMHYADAAAGWQRRLARLRVGDTYARWLSDVAAAGLLPARQGGLRVLDAGIGTGEMTGALVAALGVVPKLHGLDSSPGMLGQAAVRLAGMGLEPELRVGDVRQPPYVAASFDVVMAAHVIEHLANPSRGLASLGRLLRPGGLLMLALTPANLTGRLIQWRWRTHRFDPAGARSLVADAGLVECRQWSAARQGWGRQLSVLVTARKPAGREL